MGNSLNLGLGLGGMAGGTEQSQLADFRAQLLARQVAIEEARQQSEEKRAQTEQALKLAGLRRQAAIDTWQRQNGQAEDPVTVSTAAPTQVPGVRPIASPAGPTPLAADPQFAGGISPENEDAYAAGGEMPAPAPTPTVDARPVSPVGSAPAGTVDARPIRRSMTIPGIPEAGVPDEDRPVLSRAELVQREIEDARIKYLTTLQKYGQGEVGYLGGAEVGRGEAKPVSQTPHEGMIGGRPSVYTLDEQGHPVVLPGVSPMPKPATATTIVNPGNMTKSGTDYLSTLDPGPRRTVEGLLDGSVPIAAFSIRNGERARWVEMARAADPAYSPLRYEVRKAFTDPNAATSKNVRSLNTAVAHAGKLAELGAALQNGDMQGVNRFVNWVKQQTGNSSVTNFQTAVTAVSGESANVFKNSGGTDQEIAKWQASFATAQSPKQIQDALHTLGNLLEGRMEALQWEWQRVFGADKFFPLLSPSARATMKGLGIDYGRVDPDAAGAGGGGTPLRKEIPGHAGSFAVSTDGGKTWRAE